MNEDQHLEIVKELANIKGEMKNICISFTDFKHGIGTTVQAHDHQISQMEGKVELMLWIAAKVATPILTAIGVGVLIMAGWTLFHK